MQSILISGERLFMKRIVILTTILTLLLTASVFAQNSTPDYSGSWELDINKSKLDERMRPESVTMNVTQTDRELKIQTTTNRTKFLDENMQTDGGGANRGGGFGRGGFANGTVIYNLDGSEVKTETTGGARADSTTFKAEFGQEGRLILTSSRTFNSPAMGGGMLNIGGMGGAGMTMTVKETWELGDGGKTLKIWRETQTPRGANNSELIFTKKDPNAASNTQTTAPTNAVPQIVSGGVVNNKAISLVKPAYPEEAKAAKASGAVNVQVTIDEQGNVISAQAVSGDPLLRTAAEDAARASKFSPTLLSGAPVKVTGVIVYNFVR
jgi:TonB family protein